MGELTLVGGLAGANVVLRPVTPEDAPALLHIASAPELQPWREVAEFDEGWPLSDQSSATRFTILAGLRIAGMIQYWENDDPQYRYAGMDIFLDPGLHGRGLGRDAVRTLAQHLFNERGHQRLIVDTSATNEVAIRCYAAVGFHPIGIMRAGERHLRTLRPPAKAPASARLSLAMDMLAAELR